MELRRRSGLISTLAIRMLVAEPWLAGSRPGRIEKSVAKRRRASLMVMLFGMHVIFFSSNETKSWI